MPGNVNEIEADERIVEIEMERLREFRNHPFKVKADQQMLQLIASINQFGILNPLIVRPVRGHGPVLRLASRLRSPADRS